MSNIKEKIAKKFIENQLKNLSKSKSLDGIMSQVATIFKAATPIIAREGYQIKVIDEPFTHKGVVWETAILIRKLLVANTAR